MDTSALELRIANLRILPVMPEVLRRLNETSRNPNSSADDFARCVAHDAGLASRVMRIANSAVFCPSGGRVRTLRHAVVLLGMRTLRGLILAFSMNQGLSSRRGDSQGERAALWRHSIATGAGARVIATLTQVGDPNEIFIAGLLHDVGILVLHAAEPEILNRAILMAQGGGMTLIAAEREVSKHTHEDWGMAAARFWGLPDMVVNAAGYHHRPWEPHETGPTTACVHVSDCLAAAEGITATPAAKPDEIVREALKTVGLPDGQLEEIGKVVVSQTDKASEAFGLALAA
jgi:HD-like signal output (HDOD) protein